MNGTALITGASGGIGKALADKFAQDGHSLVLVARSKEKLEQYAEEYRRYHGVGVKVIAKDLYNAEVCREIYEELQREQIQVDYLVNNAGFGLWGTFLETDGEDELRMIDLNCKTLTYMTKLFLPGMVERGHGGILNVASMAAFQPGPLMAVYYATKAYVLSLSGAIADELRGTGVSVTALCPGQTATNFVERANLGQSKLFQGKVMDVKKVADIGYRAFFQGKLTVVPGAFNSVLAFFSQRMPISVSARVARAFQERV
jgi:uncharacterized protein